MTAMTFSLSGMDYTGSAQLIDESVGEIASALQRGQLLRRTPSDVGCVISGDQLAAHDSRFEVFYVIGADCHGQQHRSNAYVEPRLFTHLAGRRSRCGLTGFDSASRQ
jgi:hypothetical protein